VFESHFGLSAPPFQLNPDPTFYFGSKGHSNALAYLQYGVHQAEGFIVVTGEIGAGKTTLVRTLLEGLDSSQVRAAQIASTQLDATAFGVPQPAGPVSKPSLISTLEAFFMTLAMKSKRALLVVDEAQNLSMDAIEELRMLSNFQLRKQALLQSFLVGQPELRSMLESQRLEQLRQRVIASCHLGPLDLDETQRYIEHRLNRVGWSGSPRFESSAAFVQIHQATGGIPRRINLLCNRLLLSAFLENINEINQAHVQRIAAELRSEVGEAAAADVSEPSTRRTAVRNKAVPVPLVPASLAMPPSWALPPSGQGTSPYSLPVLHRIVRHVVPEDEAPQIHTTLVCLVDSPGSYFKAALFAQALHRQDPAGIRVLVVACKTAQHLGVMEHYAQAVDLPGLEIHLGVDQGTPARCIADVVLRFETVMDEFLPQVVVPFGLSDELVACTLLAARQPAVVVRLDAGYMPPESFASWRLNTQLLNQAAHWVYATHESALRLLTQQGVPAERVQVVGSLVHDAVLASQSCDLLTQALLTQHGLGTGFVMIASKVGVGHLSGASLGPLLAMLSRVRGNRQMLWVVCGETQSALRAQGLAPLLARSGIALASTPMFSARLNLLHRASYLITDERDELVEMACVMGKKLLLIDEYGDAPATSDTSISWLSLNANDLGLALPQLSVKNPEGGAAMASVQHLTQWLEHLQD
jgi:general secretion pathway protein A